MTATAEKLAREVLTLSEEDRSDLTALLLASLEVQADPGEEAAWVAEIERRAADLESGAVRGIPWEEVRATLRGGTDAS